MKTDAEVLHDVIVAIEVNPGLRVSPFYVDVKSRIVTVRGRVKSISEREEAERTIRGVVGMRALVLEIAVSSGASAQVGKTRESSEATFDFNRWRC